ncbi:hypothetical protein RB614_15740 [Phytohabitans sp. ZYX-F-186]|uniref:N-acetyltransferase domain-containing protein n=1 Tax=Phytohabitans maris TaxID=3071409 RepID=A0ABU0ZG01_9ACTN|nr:hypothetical protein [Phytohabitans sp. ZYX-F-186]MDQ7905965.1 hypothetical protein [Phytohabitans sp. ZYX-F-186]
MLAALMRDALADCPVGAWLIADPATRREIFGRYLGELAALAVADPATIVDVTVDQCGYALWYDTGEHSAYLERDALLTRTCGRYADRFRLLDTVTRYALTRAGFHTGWLLAGIGVHPLRRRTGIATVLLTRRLRHLDSTGRPLWSIAVSEAHRLLLERHGYTTLQPATFLPDSGPPIWPMRLERRGAERDGSLSVQIDVAGWGGPLTASTPVGRLAAPVGDRQRLDTIAHGRLHLAPPQPARSGSTNRDTTPTTTLGAETSDHPTETHGSQPTPGPQEPGRG